MYYLYYIVSEKTNFIYIGITYNLKYRWANHKCSAKRNVKSPLYDCMRKHGINNFLMVLVNEYQTREEAQQAEIKEIKLAREKQWKILNVADGGEGGYVIPEDKKSEWVTKLRVARKGKTPALGMKHTEENKKFFSECNKRKVLRYPTLDFSLGFTKNHKLYGISKTHYYRLLKRIKSNELN